MTELTKKILVDSLEILMINISKILALAITFFAVTWAFWFFYDWSHGFL
ncbi:MAG TPA: hypothetical protein GX707_20895 [Epulopiscium sp.]|nr:hypothetical protein [Candidatus Epulonipiscium sp.]